MIKPLDQYTPSNIRVLHVDDEPIICDVTRLCLEQGGRFRVESVNSAEEALALLKESEYACVISDYEMPSMNGIELLKEFRSFDQETPFILFSGRGRETVIIDAINTGADFYIQKGGDAKSLFAELNHKVDYAINKRNARLSLKRRDAILQAVSLVATLFLGGEPFQKALIESLTLFGLSTEVDRVMVYRLCEEPEKEIIFHRLCSWNRPGVNTGDKEGAVIPAGSLSFIEKIFKGEVVIGTSEVFDDPTGILLEKFNIKSLAVFPVIVEQKIRGMVMFCDCLAEREWAVVEIDALQAAASIIGSAMNQDEMRTELIFGKEKYESMYSMMRQLCDAVPDMLWAKDLNGRFIFVNKQTATGLLDAPDTDQPVGKLESDYRSISGSAFSIPDAFNKPRSHLPGIEDEAITEITHRTIRSRKKNFELEIRSVPFFHTSGELIGTVAVGRDVTEAHNARKMIEAERKRYLRIFHSVHIGMISCTTEGIITGINSRAVDLLDLASDQGTGMNLLELPAVGNNNFIKDFSHAVNLQKTVYGKGEFPGIQGKSQALYYSITPQVEERSGIIDLILTIDEHYQDIS
jgi:CheY-like chemotaxis protein